MLAMRRVFLTLIVFVMLSYLANAVSISGTTHDESEFIACDGGPTMFITDSNIIKSTIECANVTNVDMFDSRIINPTRTIEDAELEFAVISGDILQSGKMVYGPWTYYGPFNINQIYAGVPPSELGVAGTSVDATRQGSFFYVTYSSGRVGYTVTVDASNVGGPSDVPLLDNGLDNDLSANDGIYTSGLIEVTTGVSGTQELIVSVNDNLGNQWTISLDILIDNDEPFASIAIDPSGTTNSRMVTLSLTASDDYSGVFGCRVANSEEDLESISFGDCQSVIPWVLTTINGEKTVYFQVMDNAGNIVTEQDTVTLNIPSLSDPPLVDDFVDFWGYDDRVNFRIYYDIPVDTSGFTYNYRIYDIAVCDGDSELDTGMTNSCNITPWTMTEIRNVWHYGLSLEQDTNYTIGVVTLSGGQSEQGFSDGFLLDLVPPTINPIVGSVPEGGWTSDSVISFNLSGNDSVSGVSGFSYRVSQSNLLPNNVIDIHGDDVTIYLTGLGSGTYNLTVRARNDARSFSEVIHYTFNVESQRPPPPFAEVPFASGTGNLTFSWSPVSADSGIEGYEVVVALDPFFENVIQTDFVTGTSYDFFSDTAAMYHFKVRARTIAGLYSLFSDQFGAFYDVTPPKFVNVKPRGLVSRERPVLYAETDERAECFYGENPFNLTKFDFTGGFFHENIVSLSQGEHTYFFVCRDPTGNENSTQITFNIDSTRTPNTITSEQTSLTAFTSEFYSFNVNLRSSNVGIGELDLNRFSFLLNGRNYEEFSVNDIGNGTYVVSFRSPSREGSYNIEACYGNLCTGSLSLTVNSLNFEVSVTIPGSSDINQMSRLSYSTHNNYTIGIASDSDYIGFNNVPGEMRMKSLIGSGQSIILILPDTVPSSVIDSKNRRLQSRIFFSDNNPSFSLPANDDLNVKISLLYGNIDFSGFERTARAGEQNLLISNRGLTSDRRINITLDMS